MLNLYKRQPRENKLHSLLPLGFTMEENVDTLLFLDYLMFMERLAEESKKYMQKNNISSLQPEHLDEVAELVLQEFRG